MGYRKRLDEKMKFVEIISVVYINTITFFVYYSYIKDACKDI